MEKSLLFIPDISGFTAFIQNTEVEHSQHVIAELLEVLLKANTQQLQLAEIEGDALFFYKENEVLSQEKLLAQIESMFTAFYSHLKLLEKNRVCTCNACATAPNLQLKIIAHCGELQFITVQGKRKPFGQQVIEVHRLLKNNVPSDNYALLSQDLVETIMMPQDYSSRLYQFRAGKNHYDQRDIHYIYSVIDNENLRLLPIPYAPQLKMTRPPDIIVKHTFPIAATELLEYITNYKYRHRWVEGAEEFIYDENEVTRLGSEHVCVIGGRHFNFTVVTKAAAEAGDLVYGERSTDPPFADTMIQFYILKPLANHQTLVQHEIYLETKSLFKKLFANLIVKRKLRQNISTALQQLETLVKD